MRRLVADGCGGLLGACLGAFELGVELELLGAQVFGVYA